MSDLKPKLCSHRNSSLMFLKPLKINPMRLVQCTRNCCKGRQWLILKRFNWATKLSLKIRFFSCQSILNRLPSGLQIATRHGPSNGACALCGAEEDAAHIFFTYSAAMFVWSVIRQVLGRTWCPASLPQFFAILSRFSGQARQLL